MSELEKLQSSYSQSANTACRLTIGALRQLEKGEWDADQTLLRLGIILRELMNWEFYGQQIAKAVKAVESKDVPMDPAIGEAREPASGED